MNVKMTMDINMKKHKGIHGFVCAYEDIKSITSYMDSWLKNYFDDPKGFNAEYGQGMQIINGYLHRAVLEAEGVDTVVICEDNDRDKESADGGDHEGEHDEVVCFDNWDFQLLKYKREMGVTKEEWDEFLRRETEYSKMDDKYKM